MQKSSTGVVYLGKEGKTFGPFTTDELARFRDTGEISQYSWIWESQESGWQPLQAPPPPPPGPAVASTPLPTLPASTSKSATPEKPRALKPLQVLCYDQRSVISGAFMQADAQGALLTSDDASQSLPPFARGGRVTLSLLDPEKMTSENVSATLVGFNRVDGKWKYELKWSGLPKVLS